MLKVKGIDNMHHTTVAKIEAGDREIKLDEAVAMADLYEVPLEVLLGRRPGAQRTSELAYLLRVLRDTAERSSQQVWVTMETIREQLEELPREFDGADMLQKVGHDTWSNRLVPAYDALKGLVHLSQELLRREQGGSDLSQVPMETLLSKIFQGVQVLSHQQAEQTEANDEAQS